jgi:hypothetical protein
MSTTRAIMSASLAVVGVLALPDLAHACAMCFSGPEESRKAFFVTAAFMTLLPLGMVAGATTWLRSKARAAESEQDGANDEAGGGPTSL